mgnify:FL=1
MKESEVIKGKFYSVHIDAKLKSLRSFLKEKKYSSVIVLTDSNTQEFCLEEFLALTRLKIFFHINIEAGEENKTLETAIAVWNKMLPVADRKSLLINLGGGVVSDTGAFAASVFKRGIDFINVPTTLLSMTDAAIGGKNGVDFGFKKNQLGTFAHPKAIFISVSWLKSVSDLEMKSAYGEIAKQALLDGKKRWKNFLEHFSTKENTEDVIASAIKFKLKIVDKDLKDHGIRKQLNLGHTVGHALESFCLEKGRPVPHGMAVAAGMICELRLSEQVFKKKNFFHAEIEFLKINFPRVEFSESELPEILSFISSDKKNENRKVKPALLEKIGKANWENEVSLKKIEASLNEYIKS